MADEKKSKNGNPPAYIRRLEAGLVEVKEGIARLDERTIGIAAGLEKLKDSRGRQWDVINQNKADLGVANQQLGATREKLDDHRSERGAHGATLLIAALAFIAGMLGGLMEHVAPFIFNLR